MPTRKDEKPGAASASESLDVPRRDTLVPEMVRMICGGRLRRRWVASLAGTSGAIEPLNKHAAENRTKRRSKWKDTGCLKDQVDSAGNRTGSDQLFGWREENRLR
jgi:hypothetical protein